MKATPVNSLPVADFSGSAQQLLYCRYGDPRQLGWESKWMVRWEIGKELPWFPAAAVYLHRDFKPKLEVAFGELVLKGLHTEIHSFDGAFNIRYVRGSNAALSVHSWGAAIDMNAAINPLGSSGVWSNAFLEIMLVNGIFCGQNWIGRKDPMHFAMVNG